VRERAGWLQSPHIPWPNVRGEARRRAAGAARKLGDIELEVVLEEVDRLGAPRLVLDLRDVQDDDELVTSEYFSLGPQLQRVLRERASAPLVLYRLGHAAVAEAFAAQFARQSQPARQGQPAQPLLGVAEIDGRTRVLGPLPRYLEPTLRALTERGELTAADLSDALGLSLAVASDYLGELHRLRVAARERENLPGGGARFRYALAL